VRRLLENGQMIGGTYEIERFLGEGAFVFVCLRLTGRMSANGPRFALADPNYLNFLTT
jgi:hypothetical protein